MSGLTLADGGAALLALTFLVVGYVTAAVVMRSWWR